MLFYIKHVYKITVNYFFIAAFYFLVTTPFGETFQSINLAMAFCMISVGCIEAT